MESIKSVEKKNLGNEKNFYCNGCGRSGCFFDANDVSKIDPPNKKATRNWSQLNMIKYDYVAAVKKFNKCYKDKLNRKINYDDIDDIIEDIIN